MVESLVSIDCRRVQPDADAVAGIFRRLHGNFAKIINTILVAEHWFEFF